MNVGEIIKILQKCNPKSKVFVVLDNNDGCETCGYGSSTSEEEVFDVFDVDTKVWIKTS